MQNIETIEQSHAIREVYLSDIPENFIEAKFNDNLFLVDNIEKTEDFHFGAMPFPVKSKFFSLLFCVKGKKTVQYNAGTIELTEGMVFVLLQDMTFQVTYASPDSKIFGFHFSQEKQPASLESYRCLSRMREILNRRMILKLSSVEIQGFWDIYRLMKFELRKPATDISRKLADAYMHIMDLKIMESIQNHPVPFDEAPMFKSSRQETIYYKFKVCLEKNYRQERSISFYADQLCITPKYLSAVIKQVSGLLAGNMIAQCVILEAKALLKDGVHSVKEVSVMLNFPSQSGFGRYFKHYVNMSPSEYMEK